MVKAVIVVLEINIAVKQLFMFICGLVSLVTAHDGEAVTDLVARLAGIVVVLCVVP